MRRHEAMRRNDAGQLRAVAMPEGQAFAWIGDSEACRVYKVAASFPTLTQSRERRVKFATLEEARDHASGFARRMAEKWQAKVDAVMQEEPADWSAWAKANEPSASGVAS